MGDIYDASLHPGLWPAVFEKARGSIGASFCKSYFARHRSKDRVFAPGLPTMMEAGVPDYEVTTFNGFVAPAGTPGPIVARLNANDQ